MKRRRQVKSNHLTSTRIKNRRKKSCGFFVFIQNCCTFGTIFACKEHEPKERTIEEWLNQAIESAKWDINYNTEEYEKEQKHIADINKYLKGLYEAIDEFEKSEKMIKSVTFPNKGDGYIYKTIERPTEPNRSYREFCNMSDDEFNDAKKLYEADIKVWEVHKDEYALSCSKNLVGKTFNFEDKKVNILFGPNASGKTTILRAIAGAAIIKDCGFTCELTPRDCDWNTKSLNINKIIAKIARNTANVDWDGEPLYYYTPSAMSNPMFSTFGVMSDMVFGGDVMSEVTYHISKGKASGGQMAAFMFNKIYSICAQPKSLSSIVAKLQTAIDKHSVNDFWANIYKCELDYLKTKKKYDVESPITLLLDEIDDGLDITTTSLLYDKILPQILKTCNNQIILISHNPLVLSKTISDRVCYNLISLDEDYTNAAREILKECQF